MRTLFLSGHGIDIRVENAHLMIKDGHEYERAEPSTYELKPKYDEYDNIVVYGHSGNITFEAIKWLSKQNIQLTVLNWDGCLLTNILIPEPKAGSVRLAQYQAYSGKMRVDIARRLIEAKIHNSILVLDWLCQRYPELRKDKKAQFDELESFQPQLPKATTVAQIRGVEGMVAKNYWAIVLHMVDDKLGFEGRLFGKTGRPMAAVDPVNTLLNYGYSLLEAHCWRAINASGFDPYIGFVHETTTGKTPLAYDLQEPFRWLVDVAVFNAIEHNIFTKKDFVRTDNYVLRLRSVGARKLITEVNAQLTAKVPFRNKHWEWGYVITQKAGELADYLQGKSKVLDLRTPTPLLVRDDSAELRGKVLTITYAEWQALGYSKGTLHHLKKSAAQEAPFTLYGKVRERIVRI